VKLAKFGKKGFRASPLLCVALLFLSVIAPFLATGVVSAATPTMPFVWVDGSHSAAISADGQVFLEQGYVCPGATKSFNPDGTIADAGAATNHTKRVAAPTEGNAEKAGGSDVPTCGSSGYSADYVWTTQTKNPLYILQVSLNGMSGSCKNIVDTKVVPIGVNLGNNCTVAASVASVNNQGTPQNYKTVGTMKVDPTKQTLVDAAKAAVAAANGDNSTGPSKPQCVDTGGFGLSWIICPIFNGVASFSDWAFQNIVQPFLVTTPISVNAADSSFRVWSQFRIYGNILLVIGLLVLVFGQSIGGGLLDAYTVKKAMPRILIAAILINLSIYIVAGLVDITNVLGGTLGNVMTAPLKNAGAFQFTPSGVQAGAILGGLGGTTIAGIALYGVGTLVEGSIGSAILLFIVMPVVLGLLAAFITLILRKAIILALVLVSPVAFALYCLPNTEKYFRKWWDFLVQTLMVYPIVIVIFAVADILSVTVYDASNPDPGARTTALIIAFVLQFLPLLMIPYAFKLAGGAVGMVHETLTNYHKRGQEAVKGNVNDPLSLRNKVRSGATETLGRRRAANIRAGHPGDASGLRKLRSRVAFGLPGGRNYAYGESRRNAAAQKLNAEMSATGDDSQRYAAAGFYHRSGDRAESVLTMGDGSKIGVGQAVPKNSWFNGKGREISDIQHSQAMATFGRGQASAAQNLEYVLGKKQTDDDVGNFRHAFAQQAIAQNWTSGEAAGNWAAATYAHKSTIGSEWYSKPTVIPGANGKAASVSWKDVSADSGAYNAFIKDPHKNRQSFELSKMNDMDWRAMGKHQKDIEDTLASGGSLLLTPQAMENYVMTSEVLETASNSQGVQFNPEGKEFQVSGVTPASRGVIEAALNNRRYGVAQTPQVDAAGRVTGQESLNDRTIYEFDPVQAVKAGPGGAAGRPGTSIAVQQAVADHAVGHAKATGEITRPNVPRNVTPSK
jgi:hypothetical protein